MIRSAKVPKTSENLTYKIEFSVSFVNEIPGVLVLVKLGELLPVFRIRLVGQHQVLDLLHVDGI